MRAKAHLRIGDAARHIGVSPSTLRRWEQLGLITSARTSGGYRIYSPEAVHTLQRIHQLRSVDRINPAGIRYVARFSRPRRDASPAAASDAHLARQLAEIRKQRLLTTAEVARKLAISPGDLLAIEGGRMSLSVPLALKLSRLYRTTLSSLVAERPGMPRPLVRPADRRLLLGGGVQVELLVERPGRIDPQMLLIAPKHHSGAAFQFDGEAFVYMLDGKLEVWLDEVERYVLEAGDCLHFACVRPHRWKALSERDAVVLWITARTA